MATTSRRSGPTRTAHYVLAYALTDRGAALRETVDALARGGETAQQ